MVLRFWAELQNLKTIEPSIKTTFKKSNSLTFGVFNIFNGKKQVNTIHVFKTEGLEGEVIDFAAFTGKKIIVEMLLPNLASRRIQQATGAKVVRGI